MISTVMLIKRAEDILTKANKSNARFDAEIMLMHILNTDRVSLYTSLDNDISEIDEIAFMDMIKQRVDGTPLQHIIGYWDFMGLTFKVNSDVLIPRQDTEILVQTVIDEMPNNNNLRIADIGTGSGIIAISLAKHLADAHVTATDISSAALDITRYNAINNKVNDRIEFLLGDMIKPLINTEKYDAIVSNPPYIESCMIDKLDIEVKKHDPIIALDGGNDGLKYYRIIINDAYNLLKDSGLIAFEIGSTQKDDVESILHENGNYKEIKSIKDFADNYRVVTARKV